MGEFVTNGTGWVDTAITLNRMVVGLFFFLSGINKLLNSRRHQALAEELRSLGVPAVGFNQWWVPAWEVSGGAALVVGLLAPFFAIVLLAIILVALVTSGPKRVRLYRPINAADWFDDWLFLPETLYAVMLFLVIAAGAGPLSLDAWLWPPRS